MDTSQRARESTNRVFAVAAVWGLILWTIGYAAAMALFTSVPTSILGWIVSAIMIPATVYVSLKIFRKHRALNPLVVGAVWVLFAVVLDYFLIVVAFDAQNYYDLDIFIYYALTFLIPAGVGLQVRRSRAGQ